MKAKGGLTLKLLFEVGEWLPSLPDQMQDHALALLEYGANPEKLRLALGIKKQSGRKATDTTPIESNPVGAPRKWQASDWENLIFLLEEGKSLLKEQGKTRISDRAAIEAVYEDERIRQRLPFCKKWTKGKAL